MGNRFYFIAPADWSGLAVLGVGKNSGSASRLGGKGKSVINLWCLLMGLEGVVVGLGAMILLFLGFRESSARNPETISSGSVVNLTM